jgi:hypothetical protein
MDWDKDSSRQRSWDNDPDPQSPGEPSTGLRFTLEYCMGP